MTESISSEIGDGNFREKKNRKDKAKSLSTKVVIRRLPPTMNEETFLKQIDPIPEYDYFYFVNADWSLGQNATSRAYINFLHEDDIFIFKDRFDGYVFVESNGGIEYPAVVEFAPFQGLPKTKSRKKDNKCNTIESDPHYIQFIAQINGEMGEIKSEMKMEYSYQIKDEKKITSTPLLEYIANKKIERREERRKKIDERKKQRDDDRNRKKNQVAKSIPTSIQEEDEDGIIVRTIKSRPRDRDRDRFRKERESSGKYSSSDGKNSKSDINSDEKRKLERERENRRKEERQRFKEEREQKRQAERDRNRKERESVKKDDSKDEKVSAKQETDNVSKGGQKEDRVKRYSESRRARNEIKEQKSVESSQKNDAKEKPLESSATNKCDDNKEPVKDNKASTWKSCKNDDKEITESGKGTENNIVDPINEKVSKEDRTRRIRNKDRPSLQIYQPGKRRMSTKKDDEKQNDESSPKTDSKPTSPTLSENSTTFSVERNSVDSVTQTSGEKSKKDKPLTGDKSTNSIEKIKSDKLNESSKYLNKHNQSNGRHQQLERGNDGQFEKKVSRYSERRNKNKEKQIAKPDVQVDGDELQSNETTSEIQE